MLPPPPPPPPFGWPEGRVEGRKERGREGGRIERCVLVLPRYTTEPTEPHATSMKYENGRPRCNTKNPLQRNVHILEQHVASFPGLPTVQLFITYSMQKQKGDWYISSCE